MLQGDLKLEVSFGAVSLCCVVPFINKRNTINCASLEKEGQPEVGRERDKRRALFLKAPTAGEM